MAGRNHAGGIWIVSARRRAPRIVLSIVAAQILSGVPSHADDHRLPNAVLHSDEEKRDAYLLSSEWFRRDSQDPERCQSTHTSNVPGFPRALPNSRGSIARVRLKKNERPHSVAIRRWTRVDSDGQPQGKSRRVLFRLRPHNRGGETRAWEARFRPRSSTAHFYGQARVEWLDQEGCGVSEGSAVQYQVWRFHLRLQ